MKRTIILLSLLLASCIQQSSSDSITQVPLNEFFEHSERCPHLCWMNIKPSVTTMEEATTLLIASGLIDQQSIKYTEYGIAVKWYMDPKSTSFSTWVKIYVSDNDVNVKSIAFVENLYPYTVKDFIELLGEPDEISIAVRDAPDARYLKYALYYTSLNTFFYTSTRGKMIGPDPGDTIADMYLDTNLDDDNLPFWIIRDNKRLQPWLGYGHLDDYFPRVEHTQSP